jgi:hypothetical protein
MERLLDVPLKNYAASDVVERMDHHIFDEGPEVDIALDLAMVDDVLNGVFIEVYIGVDR